MKSTDLLDRAWRWAVTVCRALGRTWVSATARHERTRRRKVFTTRRWNRKQAARRG